MVERIVHGSMHQWWRGQLSDTEEGVDGGAWGAPEVAHPGFAGVRRGKRIGLSFGKGRGVEHNTG